jgi:hypothetical protein
MKKIGFLLIFISFVLAQDINIDLCGVFTNVLQTRKDPSQIKMNGDATIYDSPGCGLFTGDIDQGEWYRRLFCGEGDEKAYALREYANGLNDNEIFTWEFEDSQASKNVGRGSSYTVENPNENLTNDKYKTISQDSNHYSFTWSPSGNDIGVYKFYKILNSVTIDNIENKDVKIGKFITGTWSETKLIFNQIPDKIEIGKLSVSGSNGFDASWEAKEEPTARPAAQPLAPRQAGAARPASMGARTEAQRAG